MPKFDWDTFWSWGIVHPYALMNSRRPGHNWTTCITKNVRKIEAPHENFDRK